MDSGTEPYTDYNKMAMIAIVIFIMIVIIILIYKSIRGTPHRDTLQWTTVSYVIIVFLLVCCICIELPKRCDKHLIGLLVIVIFLVILLGIVELMRCD